MIEKNKIDDFFNRRLDDFSESENGWNIPNIAIWDEAKKEILVKKKKRKFIFFLLGMGLFLFISIGSIYNIYYMGGSPNHQGIVELEPDNKTKVNIVENSSISNEVSDNLIVKDELKESISLDENIVSLPIPKDLPNKIGEPFTILPSINPDFQNPVRESILDVDSTFVIFENNLESRYDFSSSSLVSNVLSFLPLFSTKLDLKVDEFHFNKPFFAPQKKINVTPIKKPWEMGVSHSRYPVNPFTGIDKNDRKRNKDISLIDSKYRSFNIVITKYLTNRISLSSGLYYTKQEIVAGFKLNNLIYENDSGRIEENLRGISNAISNSSLNTNEELKVVFLPGVNVVEGDTLNLIGQLPVSLQVYQIPFLFNYELGKRKLKFLLSFGFSLDVLKISIDKLPVEIYRGTTLVSDNVNFRPFKRTINKGNVYLGGGLRYHIYKDFHLISSFKFEPFTPSFSRYEIGLNYRF